LVAGRQHIIDTDRQFHFVLTEGALRWHVGSPQVMVGQAEHLAELLELPNVRLGIVPWTRPTNRPVLHPFQVYDDRAVMLSTETSVALITDERDVADFAARFDLYAGFADYGDAASAVFRRLADEYRNLIKDSRENRCRFARSSAWSGGAESQRALTMSGRCS
jgi:hypothetical protein